MKQFRSTLILLVCAALLGGYIWFNERGPAPAEGQKVLLRFAPGQIESIKLEKAGQGAVFRPQNDGWQVAALKNGQTGPFVPADEDALKPLVEAAQLLQSNATLEKPGNLKEYGLEKPRSRLEINGQSVELGARPKFDASRVYARVGDTVALLPASLSDFAAKKWDDWRDKIVIRFDAAQAARFSLQCPKANAAFSKQGDDWKLEQPVVAPADSTAVDNFLSSISSTKAVQWLEDAPKDLKKWGLDKPQVHLAVGDAWLKVGKKVKDGYAAQNNLSPSVFRLGEPSFVALNQPVKFWRDKRVVQFELNKLSRVSFAQGGKTRNFVQTDGKWALEGDKAQEKADDTANSAILQLLVAVRDWQAEDFVNQEKYSGAFGLEKPVFELGGDVSLRVGQKGAKIYAQSPQNSGGTIFVLSPDVLNTVKDTLTILSGKGKP